jgi:hypothetical protein
MEFSFRNRARKERRTSWLEAQFAAWTVMACSFAVPGTSVGAPAAGPNGARRRFRSVRVLPRERRGLTASVNCERIGCMAVPLKTGVHNCSASVSGRRAPRVPSPQTPRTPASDRAPNGIKIKSGPTGRAGHAEGGKCLGTKQSTNHVAGNHASARFAMEGVSALAAWFIFQSREI